MLTNIPLAMSRTSFRNREYCECFIALICLNQTNKDGRVENTQTVMNKFHHHGILKDSAKTDKWLGRFTEISYHKIN